MDFTSSNMTTPFIERKLELEREMKLLLDDARSGLRNSSDTNKTRYALLALLDRALPEGIKLAEGCVPNERRVFPFQVFIARPNSYIAGWNACRTETLSKIQLLKESIDV